ncbi:MAG: glutathione peroxidase [Sandaracinaceae bacterium]
MSTLYDIEVTTIDGETKPLREYEGQVMLVVNTASKCGFTPQYEGLEKLHQKYGERGLSVLGFPCNQFGKQEPGSETQIASFCEKNYGVSFPMHAKVDVNGSGAHPLFRHLTQEKKGLLGSARIKWNFTKFLVNQKGEVIERFAPSTTPEKIASRVEALL